MDEKKFRWLLTKTRIGVRKRRAKESGNYAADVVKLEKFRRSKLN